MHTLIVGWTGSGKTTFATRMVDVAVNRGRKVIILDPMLDERWPDAAVVTDDPEEFEELARNSLNAWLVIDEGSESIGASRWRDDLHWVFRKGRHYGHRVTVLTQHPTDLPPMVRGQCQRLVMFGLDRDSADRLIKAYGGDESIDATRLAKGVYYIIVRGGECRLMKGDLGL